METKHTPGEWAVSKTVNDFTIYAADTNKDVALVYNYSRSVPDEEAKANANLIAAAPAMLETLKQVLSWLDEDRMTNSPLARTIYETIQTATEGN